MKESRHRRPLWESLASLSIAITSKRSSSESLASLSSRDQQTKQTELSPLPLTGALAPFLPTTQFQKPRVCILGGGFGGLYTALRLESLAWPENKKPQSGWYLLWELNLKLTLYLVQLNLHCHFPPWRMHVLVIDHEEMIYLMKVDEKLRTLERKYFGKDNPIRVAVVGCGYSGVELAATVSERLQDKGIVQAIKLDTTILPTAPPGNREAALKVDLLRGQKLDKVDVTLQPEELEVMNNVLHAKYEEARRRRSCVVSGGISVTWLSRMRRRGNGKCRKKDGKLKKKDFKF